MQLERLEARLLRLGDDRIRIKVGREDVGFDRRSRLWRAADERLERRHRRSDIDVRASAAGLDIGDHLFDLFHR